MSREIKFRAFDPIAGEMYYGYDQFTPVPNGYCDMPVMQSTGVKDSQGTDIYEGDWVTAKGSRPEHGGAIIYADNMASFVVDVSKHSKRILSVGYIEYNNLVVIGNVYQDEEIIKLIGGK